MRLMLVRHGETLWNHRRRLQGQANEPLSSVGKKQALALAPAFAGRNRPEHIVVSDLERARETAQLLGFPEALPDPRFREMDLGLWTGCLIDDLIAADEPRYTAWRAGRYTPPQGEDWARFRERVEKGLYAVLETGQSSALVVAHGGVIRAACELVIGLTPERILPVAPGTLTTFVVDSRRNGTLAGRLEGFNVGPLAPDWDAPD
jgi:glucosyl-3-phosphoglycerate phosphatase